MYRYTVLNIRLNKDNGGISVYSEKKYSKDEWIKMIKKVVDSFNDDEWNEITTELIENRIKELYNDFIIPEKGAVIDYLIQRNSVSMTDIEFQNGVENFESKGFTIISR
jgi:hypothetical protein